MNFLKQFFSFSTPNTLPIYSISVKCRRCGEIIHAQINLNNDLSAEYSESGEQTYICRKVLLGKARCFQQIEVSLTFDANRKLVSSEVVGGKMVEELTGV